ncbi:hypothetical protein [Xenorhabdus innexi]|uniref:Uncharacterized protein n=1 Tax=Xenorhabdus innexi TaxID=290109 RepID=A0A1N6MX80_9GAMM|nr:hypothetical protein [Xenorhabdus innexi]PHM28759.1 hypothetical protein Xinn_03794 [Xenorhabdus innexi]SIP73349.1 conserved exported hypothetical protein [Xenorhabdus innexi]
MGKKIIFLIFIILSSNVFASELSISVACYTDEGNKPINIKYVTLYSKKDNAYTGYVKYEKSDSAIPIVFVKDDVILSDTRPSIDTTIWNEMIKGEVNGTYMVLTQGTYYSGLIYKNKKGRQVDFVEIEDAYDEKLGICVWK